MIDWRAIDTVLLDMDGTLLDLNFDNQFWLHHVPACYARKHGISAAAACDIIHPRMHAIQGTLEWYCIYHWSRNLGLDIPALKEELAHLIRPRPGVFAFLEFLRAAGKRVWLATNAHQDTVAIKFRHVDLSPYLDRVISAHQVGAPKESALFWQHLGRAREYDPARSLFIDDNLTVLRAARSHGIARLLTIRRPDLCAADRAGAEFGAEFTALEHFRQLTPA